MKLSCVVVDDEPMARKILAEYIADVEFLELVGQAENATKATLLLTNQQVHALFLDINMPGTDGLQFLDQQRTRPATIITTAYSQFAAEGFELDALDYLVKPFSQERFLKACGKLKSYYELKMKESAGLRDDFFFVKHNGRIERVLFDDLYFVEARLHYVTLHTETEKMMVYHTMKGIEEQLPGNIFLKIHKSIIVNKTKIRTIEGNLLDIGKAKVSVSQNLQQIVLAEILKDRLISR